MKNSINPKKINTSSNNNVQFTKTDNIRSIVILCCALITALSGLVSFRVENYLFPFVLQNFFVILFASIWGQSQGAACNGIFLLLGTLGLPIFALRNGGMAYLAGDTGGFLAGYFIGSIVTGFYLGKPSTEEKTRLAKILFGCLLGFLVIYLCGIIQYFRIHKLGLSVTTIKILFNSNIQAYLYIDLIKLIICSIISYFLRPVIAKYFYSKTL